MPIKMPTSGKWRYPPSMATWSVQRTSTARQMIEATAAVNGRRPTRRTTISVGPVHAWKEASWAEVLSRNPARLQSLARSQRRPFGCY